mgnify:CR=1 FL=1
MTSQTLSVQVSTQLQRQRARRLALPMLVLAYLAYLFFAFDMPGLVQKARLDNAAILLSDFWSHKVHVTQDQRSGKLTVAIEGEANICSMLNNCSL